MNDILIILRALIGDSTSTVYTDDVLNQLIVVSAIIVQKELYFETNYTINISSKTIDPDPTDTVFQLFCGHKAAIMLISSEIRSKASNSVKIKDGPSSIDLSGSVKDFQILLDSLINQYDKMKRDYTLDNNFGYAIISPTTVSYVSPNEYS